MLGGYLGAFNDDQVKYLQRIDARSQAMMRMVSELMTLSETRNRERVAAHRPVDLAHIAAAVCDGHATEVEAKRLDFSLTVVPDFPQVWGDAEMLEQMIENFLSNAIKYTPPGGRVRVDFEVESRDTVRLKFSDTGIGIPQDARPRLFTEFFRAENAKRLEETGTGLGLTIVKDTVIQHKGTVAVDSREGQGTTFTVTLPIGRKDEGLTRA